MADLQLISEKLFKGKIKGSQIDGINVLLAAGSALSKEAMAYVLATAYHETAFTMQPIEEYGKGRGRKYGRKLKMDGTSYTTPDHIYYGRGYTQNTWFENYDKLTKANSRGWDFLNNPELLLQPEPSAWASIYSMTTGLYTGRKLSQYFGPSVNDPVNARNIVNGLDKAVNIAGYYRLFLDGL